MLVAAVENPWEFADDGRQIGAVQPRVRISVNRSYLLFGGEHLKRLLAQRKRLAEGFCSGTRRQSIDGVFVDVGKPSQLAEAPFVQRIASSRFHEQAEQVTFGDKLQILRHRPMIAIVFTLLLAMLPEIGHGGEGFIGTAAEEFVVGFLECLHGDPPFVNRVQSPDKNDKNIGAMPRCDLND